MTVWLGRGPGQGFRVDGVGSGGVPGRVLGLTVWARAGSRAGAQQRPLLQLCVLNPPALTLFEPYSPPPACPPPRSQAATVW